LDQEKNDGGDPGAKRRHDVVQEDARLTSKPGKSPAHHEVSDKMNRQINQEFPKHRIFLERVGLEPASAPE
jgi:hypothetical protein